MLLLQWMAGTKCSSALQYRDRAADLSPSWSFWTAFRTRSFCKRRQTARHTNTSSSLSHTRMHPNTHTPLSPGSLRWACARGPPRGGRRTEWRWGGCQGPCPAAAAVSPCSSWTLWPLQAAETHNTTREPQCFYKKLQNIHCVILDDFKCNVSTCGWSYIFFNCLIDIIYLPTITLCPDHWIEEETVDPTPAQECPFQ